jgi:hypothetical protein
MRGKSFALFLATVAIALIAVGCGDNEPNPLSREAFVKQGNSICSQGTEERKAASKEGTQELEESSGAAELESFVSDAVVPPIETMVEELDDLGAPKKDEKQVEAIVSGFEAGIDKLEADPSSALAGSPFAEANRRAAAFGLTECSI